MQIRGFCSKQLPVIFFFFSQGLGSTLAKAVSSLKPLNVIITPSKGSTTSLPQFTLYSTLEKGNIGKQLSADNLNAH